MIYFIYGEDTFRSQKKLKEIIEQYKKIHKSGFNLVFIDAKEKEFRDLMENFKVVSMFTEKKLFIVKNIFFNQDFQEKFLNAIEGFSKTKDIIIIYEKGLIDEKKKLFKALKKEAKCQEFKLLRDRALKVWIKKEFDLRNVKIEPGVVDSLAKYVGNELWQMSNEIDKLLAFRNGKEIKNQDIEFLIKPKIDNDIFKTIDAVAQKDRKKAISLIYKHLEKGETPLYVLSMINFQIRNILIVKDLLEKGYPYNIVLKKSGLHPFVAKKSYSHSQRFSFTELKKIYQRIFKADFNIKTGRIEPEAALEILITGI